jgi:hypothetical protein
MNYFAYLENSYAFAEEKMLAESEVVRRGTFAVRIARKIASRLSMRSLKDSPRAGMTGKETNELEASNPRPTFGARVPSVVFHDKASGGFVAPRPARLLITATKARPIPSPPCRRVVDASPC